ncbi:MAG: arylsulfatase [Hyphomonadaceae bacterium]
MAAKSGRIATVVFSLLLAMFACAIPAGAAAQDQQRRPNFLVIVADDLGFSDVGAYGGEIRTPNIDRLARQGLRFVNYYVGPSCSPTRSMLMTGLDNHVVGMGNMYERTAPNQLEQPGYEGVLRTDFRTIADALRAGGYHTYMAGKWHLGKDPEHVPAARGFERSFSILPGGGSHFSMTGISGDEEVTQFNADGEYLSRLPRNYYSTRTFTDQIIDYIESNRGDGQPFFAYLAHQAVHDPIQVPRNWVRRYFGAYDDGWDAIRERRLARQIEMGIMPPGTRLSPRIWFVPQWDDLTGIAQAQSSRRMEVYAAMVEYMDMQIGRLLDYLENTGLAENTIIIFMSDNGANPVDPLQSARRGAGALLDSNFYATNYQTDFGSMGYPDSFTAVGTPWAQVSSTPLNGYKLTTFEGGLRSPLIVWRRHQAAAGSINNADILHVSDIAPTLLDWAGLSPEEFNPPREPNMQRGRSVRAVLDNPSASGRFTAARGTEMFGGRAYRDGPWKITWMHEPYGSGEWQLFNLDEDPGETTDLSQSMPERRTAMIAAWEAYAAANNVILPDRTIYDGAVRSVPPRPPVDAPDWPRGAEPNFGTHEDAGDRGD